MRDVILYKRCDIVWEMKYHMRDVIWYKRCYIVWEMWDYSQKTPTSELQHVWTFTYPAYIWPTDYLSIVSYSTYMSSLTTDTCAPHANMPIFKTGIESFHINPWLRSTFESWNLGLTQEIPTSYTVYRRTKCNLSMSKRTNSLFHFFEICPIFGIYHTLYWNLRMLRSDLILGFPIQQQIVKLGQISG